MKFEMCSTITWSTRYYVLSNHLEEVTLLRANGPPDEMHKFNTRRNPRSALYQTSAIHVPYRAYI